jgi:hypothetical protein
MKMTAESVTARLRQMADASRRMASPMQRGVDMSKAAVTMRLREMADVSETCRKLARLGAGQR